MQILERKKSKLFGVLKFITTTSIMIGLSLFGDNFHRGLLRKSVGKNVVKIVGAEGSGSGFFVKAPSGKVYVMTNKHVCALANKSDTITYVTQPDQEIFDMKVIARSTEHDLCLIEADQDHGALKLASYLSKGEEVNAMGHPQGWPITMTKGEFLDTTYIQLVSAVAQIGTPEYDDSNFCSEGELKDLVMVKVCLQEKSASRLLVYIKPGSSGSPLVNYYGQLVGVVFAGNNQDQFESFAVPFYEVKKFLKDK